MWFVVAGSFLFLFSSKIFSNWGYIYIATTPSEVVKQTMSRRCLTPPIASLSSRQFFRKYFFTNNVKVNHMSSYIYMCRCTLWIHMRAPYPMLEKYSFKKMKKNKRMYERLLFTIKKHTYNYIISIFMSPSSK